MVLIVVVVGCGGSGNAYTKAIELSAIRTLPSERHTGAHPDSLRRLSIVEEEDRVRLELDESYEQVHLAWSSSFRFASPDRDLVQVPTHATLWSKELTLAALEAENEFSLLPRKEGLAMIEKQRKRYRDTLRIDVYWFTGSFETNITTITGAGARVRLEDGRDNSYRPAEEENDPLREATVFNDQPLLYRRNIFHFRRRVDGQDILKDVDELRLRVTPTTGPTVVFGWSWHDR